jgi:RimJ/RimL family protein N-acetyltransferase
MRPIEATYQDAELVTRWRNSARVAFFNQDIVTPDTHLEFMRKRRLHDLVWIAEVDDTPVGMVGLAVDVQAHIAEFHGLVVGAEFRRRGYGKMIAHWVLTYAFEVLGLDYVWLDVLERNTAACRLYAKVGWIVEGIDMPGHRNAQGHVAHLGYYNDRQ